MAPPAGEEEGVQALTPPPRGIQAFHDEMAALGTNFANPDLRQALDANYLNWRELHGGIGPELDPYSEEAIKRRLANLGQRESLTRSNLRRMVMEELSASDAQALALGHTRIYPDRGEQGTGFDPLLDVVVDPDTGNLIPGRRSEADPDVLIQPGLENPFAIGAPGARFSYEGDFGEPEPEPEVLASELELEPDLPVDVIPADFVKGWEQWKNEPDPPPAPPPRRGPPKHYPDRFDFAVEAQPDLDQLFGMEEITDYRALSAALPDASTRERDAYWKANWRNMVPDTVSDKLDKGDAAGALRQMYKIKADERRRAISNYESTRINETLTRWQKIIKS